MTTTINRTPLDLPKHNTPKKDNAALIQAIREKFPDAPALPILPKPLGGGFYRVNWFNPEKECFPFSRMIKATDNGNGFEIEDKG